MSNWSGNWDLGSGDQLFQDLVGKIGLNAVPGMPKVYTVGAYQPQGQAAVQPSAIWLNCVLLERTGVPGPELPWPLSTQATSAQEDAAKRLLRVKFGAAWKSNSSFERLEGDVVDSNGKAEGVVLFRSDGSSPDGKDQLFAVWLHTLFGATSPDGSASGIRR